MKIKNNSLQEDFMFVLSDEEGLRLRSQFATSNMESNSLRSQFATSKRGSTSILCSALRSIIGRRCSFGRDTVYCLYGVIQISPRWGESSQIGLPTVAGGGICLILKKVDTFRDKINV